MADSSATRTMVRERLDRRAAVVPLVLALSVAGSVAVAGPAAASTGDGARPVIVRLEPGSDPDEQARAAAVRGARVTFVYRDVFPGYAAVLPPGGLRGVEGGPGVVAVEPDTPVGLEKNGLGGKDTVQAAAPSARQGVEVPWGLDRIDQRALPLSATYSPPRASADGAGVTAYVIDSGVREDHQDLGGRVRSGFSAIDDGRGTGDCAGHGTHVAGTVGGVAHGVAEAVSLVAVRTLDCDGAGATSGVLAGIDWVARDHASGVPAVANLSLSGPASESVDAAIRALVDDGVTVAVAAGNENDDACNSSPAREPAVLTVTASARDDARASFSNRGSCVDLFAPGVDIASAWYTGPTATEVQSGTSMAAPHVTGAAALLLGAQPALTPEQVAARLVGDATPGVVEGRRGEPDRLLYVGSEPAGTDVPGAAPEPGTSEPAPSRPSDPEGAEPDTPDPDAAEPPSEPEVPEVEPDLPDPDLPDPDLPEPELPEPEPSDPDLPEPDLPDRDPSDPDLPEPDLADPDLADPDLPEPDLPDPDLAVAGLRPSLAPSSDAGASTADVPGSRVLVSAPSWSASSASPAAVSGAAVSGAVVSGAAVSGASSAS
jgi:subtilisin family serine protease